MTRKPEDEIPEEHRSLLYGLAEKGRELRLTHMILMMKPFSDERKLEPLYYDENVETEHQVKGMMRGKDDYSVRFYGPYNLSMDFLTP